MKSSFLLSILVILFLNFYGLVIGKDQVKNPNEKINALLDSSEVYFNSDYLKSASFLKEAIKIAKTGKDELILADVYIEYSKVLFTQNETEQELKYVSLAKDVYSKHRNDKGLSKCLVALARIKLTSWNYNQVLELIYDGLDHAYKSKDSLQIALTCHFLGTAYNWLNSFIVNDKPVAKFYQYCDSAEYFLNKAIDIMTRIQCERLPYSYNNLGLSLHKRANYTNKDFTYALNAHRRAIEIFKAQNDRRGMASSFQEIARCLRDQGNYQEAIKLLTKSIRIADSMKLIHQQEGSYEDLYLTYYKIKNIDSAFNYYKKYMNLRYRHIDMQSKTLLAEQEAKYKTEKKEAQILVQNKELEAKEARLKLQYGVLLVSGFALLILTGLSIFLFNLYKKNKLLSQKNVLLLKEQNHRVKNNLQVISALLSLQANLMDNNDARKAIEDSQLRVQTMGMIHKKLYGDNITDIEMDTFVNELVDSILPVFGWANNSIIKEINVTNHKLNVDKAVPIGLIINELLTNSCKYAFSNAHNPCLKIGFCQNSDKSYVLSYFDNGSGFDPNSAKKGSSFGLKLIELQSRQLFAEYYWKNETGMQYNLKFNA